MCLRNGYRRHITLMSRVTKSALLVSGWPTIRPEPSSNAAMRVDALRRHTCQILEGRALQFPSAKQLSVCSHDYGGEAHSDCADAHRQVESPSDKKASGAREGD